jgi:hypothetical protein
LPERQNFYPTGEQGFPIRKMLKSRFEIPRKNFLNLEIKIIHLKPIENLSYS